MNELIPFAYEGSSVRVLRGEDGNARFVAKDVCAALGLSNPRSSLALLDEDEKGVHSVDTPGGAQKLAVVSEAGLYSLILRSRKPEAKAFKRWVTHEVLPSIRKNGGYINPRADEHQINAIIRQAQMQMELCQAAKGLIHADHLEARARVVLARGLGEFPELDAERRPLYTQDFLKGKGLAGKALKRVAPNFGKRVKAAYIDRHGQAPKQYPMNLSNGQTRQVNAYTEADRSLMQDVWDAYYATEAAA